MQKTKTSAKTSTLNPSHFKNVQKLIKRFEKLKGETENLIEEAKEFSHEGMEEVEHLVDAAKNNWKMLVDFGTSFINGKKAPAKAKAKKGAKTVAKKVSSTAKKALKK